MTKIHYVVLSRAEIQTLTQKLEEIGAKDAQTGFSEKEVEEARKLLTRPKFRGTRKDDDRILEKSEKQLTKLEKKAPFYLSGKSITAASLPKLVEELKRSRCSWGDIFQITETGSEATVEGTGPPCVERPR